MSTAFDPFFGIAANILFGLSIPLIVYGLHLRFNRIQEYFRVFMTGIHYYRTKRSATKYYNYTTVQHRPHVNSSIKISQNLSYINFINEINTMEKMESKLQLSKSDLFDSLQTDFMEIPEDEVIAILRQEEQRYSSILQTEITSRAHQTKNTKIKIEDHYQWMATQ